MTQNVKKCRAVSPAGRAFAVLLLLSLGTLMATFGCSKTKAPDGSMAEAGTANAAGSAGCVTGDCTVSGRFTPCAASSECDEAHGFSCVAGECSYECRSHADCVAVGHCEAATVDGEHKNFCVRDATPPVPGKLYFGCPNGDECADPALCVGAGPGDLDAYCTIDCASDDDCAAGYQCGTLSRNPCAAACDEDGQPSDPRCVPLDQIGDDLPFHCGDQGVERRVCRQREFCASCTSDADCLAVPNQICAKDESGEKICTQRCDTDVDSCPWGNAGGCGYFDDDLGVATCSHRFGSCHGTGKSCEPCRNNDDCPGGACISSSFTGEHWCVDLTISCECPKGVDASGVCSNADCPPSPSGLTIQCIGDKHVCYAANGGSQTQLGSSPQTGCWGAD